MEKNKYGFQKLNLDQILFGGIVKVESDEKICLYCGYVLKKSSFYKHEKTKKHQKEKQKSNEILFNKIEKKQQRKIDKQVSESIFNKK